MNRLNILVGGPIDLWPKELVENKISGDWIGVDRGVVHLLSLGIKPKIAIGDFDSINNSEKKNVKANLKDIRTANSKKDDTDTQLALQIAMDEFDAKEIYVYGATGGRVDHFLSNLWTITEPRFKSIIQKVKIVDNDNIISFYLPGEHTIVKENDKKYLGFINLTPVENLTLIDEKYKLTNWSSSIPKSWSSNEFEGEINHFKFDSGIIAVIQTKDVL